MSKLCPYCLPNASSSENQTNVVKVGFYRRRSDCRLIQRFRCNRCSKQFSNATGHPAFGQNKRRINDKLKKLLCANVSLRRAALLLHVSRTTIDRKLKFLGAQARAELREQNLKYSPAELVEFDDLETFEHTKCKPLSVILAVESKTRRILAFEVSKMPAKGRLVHIALKKYGPRPDERASGRQRLFQTLTSIVLPTATFKADQNPHYPSDLKAAFPHATFETFKGKKSASTGQGELKKTRHDPLFAQNHTFAMTRANMSRLIRRTWCTTKNPERLADHLAIYAVYHNEVLI